MASVFRTGFVVDAEDGLSEEVEGFRSEEVLFAGLPFRGRVACFFGVSELSAMVCWIKEVAGEHVFLRVFLFP